MDQRQEAVVVETERYRVEGKMTLPTEGYRSRLSDHVNRRDHQFFTIQDATLTPLDGGDSWEAPVLMLAVAHIRLILPTDSASMPNP